MSDTRNILNEEADPIESMIRSAGHFIQPSDDLRPRALESAREHFGDKRAHQKVVGFFILGSLLVGLLARHTPDSEDWRLRATAPSCAEMHEQATAFESLPEVGSQWGLTEAFTRLRRHQASWLGHGHR